MGRQLVYPLMEILAQDINNFRKTADKTLLEIVFGNALPRIPGFIGDGFKTNISGASVVVSPGVAFQRIDQTDGSTNIRIVYLKDAQTLTITLPVNAGVTKRDLVQCKSTITNLPTESRRFNEAGGIVSKSVIVQNEWSSDIRVKQNVTANSQGNYEADLGWIPVALVESESTGIQRVTDLRNFYNLFDPDFYSVYGRKNTGFRKPYDGVDLVEVPFEFSDLVSKLSQISVRRLTKEKFGSSSEINTEDFDTTFGLTAPTGESEQVKAFNQLTLFGSQATAFLTNYYATTFNVFDSGGRRLARGNGYSFSKSDFTGTLDLGNVNVLREGNKLVLGDGDTLISGGVTTSQWNQIPSSGLYIIMGRFVNQNGVPSQPIIWNIPKNSLSHIASSNKPQNNEIQARGSRVINPVYSEADITQDRRGMLITTVNPITSVVGTTEYSLTQDKSITDFYELDSFVYNDNNKNLSFELSAPVSQHPSFPSDGQVFNRVVIKKGTETRLTLAVNNFTIDATRTDSTKSYAKYSYIVPQRTPFIKSGDTAFNDFEITFYRDTRTTGDDIWRTYPLRGGSALSNTVDFTIITEGVRTYVKLNPLFVFNADDEIIYSHIIPQSLIDAGSGGTPESQDITSRVTALQDRVNALTTKVNTNETDIDELERTSAETTQTLYYGLVSLTPKNNTNKAISLDASRINPLASALLRVPANRTAKVITSLLLTGALIRFNSGSADGYYCPVIAIKNSDRGRLNIEFRSSSGQDETNFWGAFNDPFLFDGDYHLFMRARPMLKSKTLKIFVKGYQ